MYAFAVINATCLWCLASLVTMVCIFIGNAIVAQTQGVFERNERLDLGLTFGLAVLACGALGFEGAQMRHGVAPTYDSKVLATMTDENLAPADAHVYGEKDAPITIVEFGDLFCPSCRNAYPEVKKIVESHSGAVRLVFRHFPLVNEPGHKFSWQAAVLSEYCGQRGKFWDFVDAVYAHSASDIKSTDDLLNIVQQLGLDGADADGRWNKRTDPAFIIAYQDYTLACHLGLQATPTYFILAKGVQPQPASGGEIEDYLSRPEYVRLMTGHGSK
jgi:protein-disulfide isomerase